MTSLNRTMLLGALALCMAAPGGAQTELRVERVVMLMRHGVRPPTKAQPIPAKYSAKPWPTWKTGPGLLTEHGAKGVALLAGWDRGSFASAGLLPASGCPAPGTIAIRASHVPRAVATAKAWAKGLLPACPLSVEHPAKTAPDTLFHILDTKPAWFDGQRAAASALAAARPGGLPAQTQDLGPQLRLLEQVLGCDPPACDLETEGSAIVAQPHDRPEYHGALDAASTASETFLLEYLEAKPMSRVAWGLLDREQIERLLVFNVTKFKYIDRPLYIAQAAAGPLARAIVDALTAPEGPAVTLLAGHDTNIADLGGLLGLHWQVRTYLPDDVPPGSAVGFELMVDANQRRFVRAFFRSQTMDQLRNLEPLSSANPPFRQYVDIPGCGVAHLPSSCDLTAFQRTVEAALGR